ncbi:type II toxin-antitoxin system CcdA family antitoxin [Candidatus Bathyarchaeota archaeon]|nr:type II toxin-antitoxin system CcdA family antitoxin [Candidatus Bathyarchaeota archaeon]
MRKMTTIGIDEKILKQAKELGLNVTKICENALKTLHHKNPTNKPGNNQKSKFGPVV